MPRAGPERSCRDFAGGARPRPSGIGACPPIPRPRRGAWARPTGRGPRTHRGRAGRAKAACEAAATRGLGLIRRGPSLRGPAAAARRGRAAGGGPAREQSERTTLKTNRHRVHGGEQPCHHAGRHATPDICGLGGNHRRPHAQRPAHVRSRPVQRIVSCTTRLATPVHVRACGNRLRVHAQRPAHVRPRRSTSRVRCCHRVGPPVHVRARCCVASLH